jgi:hypothetical protein
MRPRDWFAVGVRLVGLWLILHGCILALSLLSSHLTDARSSIERDFAHASARMTGELIYIFGHWMIGGVVIYGAERVATWAYPEPRAIEDDVDAMESQRHD